MQPDDLALKSIAYRRTILEIIEGSGAGHTGGSLSCIDILNMLYNHVMNVTPDNFHDPDHDRYIQSKGHSVEALYAVLVEFDVDVVILDEQTTKLGAVETWQNAKQCADLFRRSADRIDGILVTLPNFGDEKGVADTIKLSGLNVPVLVQAYPDDLDKLHVERRRDSFCGKISVCNNLYQYGIPYTLTRLHTVLPQDESFKQDLRSFLGVCRIVNSLRSARLGAIGAPQRLQHHPLQRKAASSLRR